MSTSIEKKVSWNDEKESLKLKFEIIVNRYAMFEGSDNSIMSEKLQAKLANTKEELHKIIAAL